MSEKTKGIIAAVIVVLLVVNIVIGMIVVSSIPRKGDVISTGFSAIVGNVGLIEINGAILLEEESIYDSYVDADKVAEKIRTFADAPNIRAIRVDVSSPGGSVSAAEVIVSALDYAKKKGKKIVVFMKEVAASGGYYISAPADYIMASRGTITGSIGVIVQVLNVRDLLDKIGVKSRSFKSGEHKDMLSPFREVSEKEQRLIQRIVTTYYNRFIDVVLKYRGDKIKREELLRIADGRIIIEEDALAYKLIDGIGDEFTVEEVIKELTGEKAITYVKLPERKSVIQEIMKLFSCNPNVNVARQFFYPRVLYIMH